MQHKEATKPCKGRRLLSAFRVAVLVLAIFFGDMGFANLDLDNLSKGNQRSMVLWPGTRAWREREPCGRKLNTHRKGMK